MFVKRFEHRGKHYIYDVNSNRITQVSKELWYELKNNVILKNNMEFTTLYEKGYFQEYELKELYNPFSERIEYLNDRNLSFFIFQVTQGCNLRCSYCPYSQSNEKIRHHNMISMNWEIAKKGLDYYFEHSIDSNLIGIGFYGGEPLLNFKLIKKMVEYSQRIFEGKDVHYSITTNGTLLTDEIIGFLENYNFQLLISLDGDKESTDQNRRFVKSDLSVFENVIGKIQTIYTSHKSLFKRLTINMVLDPSLNMEMYDCLIEKYPFLEKSNIYSVREDDTYSDEKKSMSSEFVNTYNYKMFLCLLEIIENFKFNTEIKLFNSQKRLLDDEFNHYSIQQVPDYIEEKFMTSGICLPGMTKTFVSVNGNFYPCKRVNENLDDMIIGNVEDGYDFKNIKNMMNFNLKFKKRCFKCFAIRECNLCPEQFGSSGIEPNEESFQVCKEQKENYLRVLKDRITYQEIKSLLNGASYYE